MQYLDCSQIGIALLSQILVDLVLESLIEDLRAWCCILLLICVCLVGNDIECWVNIHVSRKPILAVEIVEGYR